MTVVDFFNLFKITSALHGFLFCIFIFFSRNGRKRSLVYINLLILAISINNLQSWILGKNFFIDHLFVNYARLPWHFLIAPFFYMFLIHYLEIEKRSKNILKVVFPVFVVLVFIRIGFAYSFSTNSSIDLVFLFKKYTFIEEIISFVFSVSIFGYSFYILSRREKLFTRIISYDNLKWIYTFFKLSALVYIFWIIALVITVFLNFKEYLYYYYPLRVLTNVLIYWLGYQAVLQLRRLNEKKYLRKQISLKLLKENQNDFNVDSTILKESDIDIHIPKEVIKNILIGLDSFEKTQQYTSNKITLTYLAKKLKTNNNYLSKVINSYKKTSFTNYLNELRIQNIVYQLKINRTIRKFTIKAIAEEAGFNNSSSFSNAFVKIKGMKPSNYVRKLDRNNSQKEV